MSSGYMSLISWGLQDDYLVEGYRDIRNHPKLIQLRNCAGPIAHSIEKFIKKSDNIKATINSIDIIQKNTGECWTAAAFSLMNQKN